MRVLSNSVALFSRRLLRPDIHTNLGPKFFTKHIRQRENAQLDFLKAAIEKNDCDWQALKANILSKEGAITAENIDAIILKYVTTQKKFDYAYSFAKHLQSSGNKLNLGATNSLLMLYIEAAVTEKPSDEVRQFILTSYKSLYDKYKVLDYLTSERLLRALCAIDEWKLSLKILDDIYVTSTPSHATYSTLVATLFRNDEKAEAFKIIQSSLNYRRPLQDYAYGEWFKYILRKFKDKKTKEKNLEELCFYLAQNCIKVSEETIKRFKETFMSLGWSADYTSVKRASGQCLCCHRRLDNIEFSGEEFTLLQQNVKDKLIVGSDLFLKTSPTELERFLKFVNRTKPYDVVLDALNIAYVIGKSTYSEKLKALSIVVDYFLKQKKKVLLLGRKHMLNWHGPTLRELSRKTCSFYTENLSQDDPYFITAAILSGPNTDFVSRDLLRGHRFLMKQEQLRLLFQRWQWKHQWMLFSARKRPALQEPLIFTPCAQQHENGWHIPFEKAVDNSDDESYSNYEDPQCSNWLCIRKKVDSK